MKNTILLLLINLFSINCFALESSQPQWTFELGASLFEPEDRTWVEYYGQYQMLAVNVSYARRILSVLDAGFTVSYSVDKGRSLVANDKGQNSDVTYETLPIDIFLLLRARFSPNQWIVPYGGGGYTRFNYRQSSKQQGKTQGSIGATHFRFGVQFLLDVLEHSAARQMYLTYGVINSYLYFEIKTTEAKTGTPSVNIGGESFTAGVMVEY